jgi:hypothetical protein
MARARAWAILALSSAPALGDVPPRAPVHDATIDVGPMADAADRGERAHGDTEPPPSGFAPTATLLLPAIDVYRTSIGPRSVARCPFVVSCSTFAREAIRERGFLGLLSFLDRFFFRESIDAFHRYDWAVAADGSIRLDDGAPWLDAHRSRPVPHDAAAAGGTRR